MRAIETGRSVTVAAPATSANVGPGFDCFGLALDWRDRVTIEVSEHGFGVEVSGEGADRMPRDDTHLILASTIVGLTDLGVRVPGLRLTAHNTVPHGRGLGSSSAAIVSGLLAAQALAGPGSAAGEPDRAWLLRHGAAIEGHPDNVAAAIWGGFTLAYGAGGAGTDVDAVRLAVHPDVSAWVFVAPAALATTRARRLLPESVPHRDAAANSARTALLVHAIGHDPTLLPEATRDWLHQDYRRSAMPASAALVAELRAQGWAAVISGAGPSVLVLGRRGELGPLGDLSVPGFVGRGLGVGVGARIER